MHKQSWWWRHRGSEPTFSRTSKGWGFVGTIRLDGKWRRIRSASKRGVTTSHFTV